MDDDKEDEDTDEEHPRKHKKQRGDNVVMIMSDASDDQEEELLATRATLERESHARLLVLKETQRRFGLQSPSAQESSSHDAMDIDEEAK